MAYLICLLISLVLTSTCFADRSYIVLPMQGGSPVIDTTKTPYHGHVQVEQYKTTGLYMVTGTVAELDALGKLTKAQTIVKITDVKATADVKPAEEVITKGGTEPTTAAVQWAELDTKPVKADADKITATLATESSASVKPTVNETMTYREVLKKMVSNPNFERDYWVKDAN